MSKRRRAPRTPAFKKKVALEALREGLEKKVGQLTMENDVLKKN